MIQQNDDGLPLGLGMALTQQPGAMAAFAALSEQGQQAVIAQAHQVRSRAEMHALVASLTDSAPRA